ncbi:putative dihydroflavonal-4-reductase [Auriculariales sp. MPI-PUGE-AT-0066]|nr:putative dihydroflavonal-4-reductase [Auriculariales sp. MPI-PUGE-AT-0066]
MSSTTGKHVLLTGASGFLAAWVLKYLLEQGFTVRATVRSQSKADPIAAQYAAAVSSNQLTFAIVPDIVSPGAHDAAVKELFADGQPLDFVVHTASPFHMGTTDPVSQMLEPAVKGTIGVLESVHTHAPSVKRVVITSSAVAFLDLAKGPWPGKVYNESDWNPLTWEESAKPGNPMVNYVGSKTVAERAAWDFMEKATSKFDLVTLCPPFVFGPHSNDQSLDSLNTSNWVLWQLLSGSAAEVPPTSLHCWVDVSTAAQAHVMALTVPEAGGKRFYIGADEHWSFQDAADIFRDSFPRIRDKIAIGSPGTGLGIAYDDIFTIDNALSKQILGLKYSALRQTLIDTAESLLELQEKKKA